MSANQLLGQLARANWTLQKDRGNRAAALVSRSGNFLISAMNEGAVRVWDLRSKKLLRHFASHDGRVRNLALSPDERVLITFGDDGKFRILDLVFGEILYESENPDWLGVLRIRRLALGSRFFFAARLQPPAK